MLNTTRFLPTKLAVGYRALMSCGVVHSTLVASSCYESSACSTFGVFRRTPIRSPSNAEMVGRWMVRVEQTHQLHAGPLHAVRPASGSNHQGRMIAPDLRIGAPQRDTFMQRLRDHDAIEWSRVVIVQRQRGDRLRVLTSNRQLGEASQPKRRASIVRMHTQVALCMFDRDLPNGCGAHQKRIGRILDQANRLRRQLRSAFGSPQRDMRIEQHPHGASPCRALASKSATIPASLALNASTVAGMSSPASRCRAAPMRRGAVNGTSRATGVPLRAMTTSLSSPSSSRSTRLDNFDFASCMLTVSIAPPDVS